jgi:hypothetical protein
MGGQLICLRFDPKKGFLLSEAYRGQGEAEQMKSSVGC